MAAIDSPSCSEPPLPHQARSFASSPSPDQALSLLAELATAPCRYTPAVMDRPLALYGAGDLGRLARDFLQAVGHDFVIAIDRNAQKLAQDPYWAGVRLLHPDEVTEANKIDLRLAISIVTSPFVPIEQSLLERGFEDIVPFYDLAESFRHLHPLSNGWFAPPLSAQEQQNTAEVLARWDDDMSRAHHLQFLAWRRLREEWIFADAPAPDCIRFFIPEVTGALGDHDVLLDAGAYHGSVMRTFVRQTSGAFRHIVAIEPDPTNRAVLLDRLRSSLPDDPRVTVYDCALAEEKGEAPFHDRLGYASQLSATGHMRVTTRPLDAFGLSPTFIKLHLEGAELAALKGAHETLRASRPIIAATVYHNADGIWKTPHWLMQALPRYRFLFRAHSWCGTGAVVYCIPQERCASAS